MKELNINSQDELLRRILPALKSKKRLLKKDGFKLVSEQDIWDYLRLNKWSLSTGLELCDMVDDILHTQNELIAQYSHNKYMNTFKENSVKSNKKIDIEFDLPKLKN